MQRAFKALQFIVVAGMVLFILFGVHQRYTNIRDHDARLQQAVEDFHPQGQFIELRPRISSEPTFTGLFKPSKHGEQSFDADYLLGTFEIHLIGATNVSIVPRSENTHRAHWNIGYKAEGIYRTRTIYKEMYWEKCGCRVNLADISIRTHR